MTTTTPAPTTSDVEQLARLARAVEQLRGPGGSADRGPAGGGRGDPDRHPGRRARAADRRAGTRQDPDGLDGRRGARPHVQPGAVHPRPDAERHHRHRDHRGGSDHRETRRSGSCTGRSSPTSCWPTRSTARRPRPRRRCCRRCRSTRSPSAGQTYHLPEPFFVLATQNPIEQEGTYPLPEAQLDRFMLELRIGYPTKSRGRGDRRADHRRPGREARVGARRRRPSARCRTWCAGSRCPGNWCGPR